MRFASEPRRALTHPLWWSALGLLLVNDHLLKGAGLLPGWLTGKLSDLAGLIVAPVLAAALLRSRTPAARLAAFALPTLPFVAINLSPAAAHATEAVMASVGVPWRIWTDPTDLVALVALPVAWWVADGARAGTRRRAVEGVAVGLGAFACVATSPAEPFINASAWMVNHTDETIDVRLRWVEGELACDGVSGQAARALDPERFDEGLTFRLEPNRTAPIDYANAMQSSGTWDTTDRGDRSGCDAVMIEADGLPRTVVFWREARFLTVNGTLEQGDDRPERGLRILPDEGERLRVTSSDLEVAEAVERPAPSACFAPEAVTYEWSVADLPSLGVYRLEIATEGPDGCWQLDLADDLDGSTYRAFVCVPGWAFPFRGGDLLRIGTRDVEGSDRWLRITREHEDGSFGEALVVTRSTGVFREGRLVGSLEPDGCGADRTTCGAYVGPAHLLLENGDVVSPGAPMAMPASADPYGWAVTVALGRAETILVSHPDCEPGQQQLGAWADVLVLYEEEIE